MSDDDAPDKQDYLGFFIEVDECVFCGVCHSEAPENFRWTDTQYTNSRGEMQKSLNSEVHKQPETEEELKGIVSAMQICCAGCIKYGGTDPKVVEHLLDRDVDAHSIVHLDKIGFKRT